MDCVKFLNVVSILGVPLFVLFINKLGINISYC